MKSKLQILNVKDVPFFDLWVFGIDLTFVI